MIPFDELIRTKFPDFTLVNTTEKSLNYERVEENYSRLRVVVLDKSVIVSQEGYVQGVNVHSGAKWSRWKTEFKYIYSVKQQRDGRPLLRIYEVRRKKNSPKTYIINRTGSVLHRTVDYFFTQGLNRSQPNSMRIAAWAVLYKFAEATGETLPDTLREQSKLLIELAYPPMRFFPEFSVLKSASSVRINGQFWSGRNDIKQYTQKVFGAKSVRKDVIKTFSHLLTPGVVELMSVFKNLVPVEWLLKMLKAGKEDYVLSKVACADDDSYALFHLEESWKETREGMKLLFALMTVKEKKTLFFDKSTEVRIRDLMDAARLASMIGPQKLKKQKKKNRIDVSSWKRLHDSLVIAEREVDRKSEKIKMTPLAQVAHKAEFEFDGEKYLVESPKSVDDLYEWGRLMHNCIGSYGSQVKNNATQVFAVYDSEKNMVANVEYHNKRVIQFVKKYNQPVGTPMREAFVKKMAELHHTKQYMRLLHSNR